MRLLIALLAVLLGCAEPPTPEPVTTLPDPCRPPMVLDPRGACVPSLEGLS